MLAAFYSGLKMEEDEHVLYGLTDVMHGKMKKSQCFASDRIQSIVC